MTMTEWMGKPLPRIVIKTQPSRFKQPRRDVLVVSSYLKQPKLGDIIEAVCFYMNVSREELQSHRRFYRLRDARMVYYWIARKNTSASYPQIGSAVGGRDHSTVMNGIEFCTKHSQRMSPHIHAVLALLK